MACADVSGLHRRSVRACFLYVCIHTHTHTQPQRAKLAAAQAQGRDAEERLSRQAADHEEQVTELLATLRAVRFASALADCCLDRGHACMPTDA